MYFNELPDGQSAERSRDEVTFFYVGDFLSFVYTLALSMPIFKKKSLRRFLDKMPDLLGLRLFIYDSHVFFMAGL